MGYSKSKVQEQIHIRMKFRLINTDTETEEICEVVHVMRPPTVSEREEYHRLLARVKGKKVSSNVDEATWHLWNRCIVSVEGYDDIPAGTDFRSYFSSGVERIHADEAVNRLLESFESEDTEVEKKFVQSSGH